MHAKQAERRIRERLKAWETARTSSPGPARSIPTRAGVGNLKLAQTLEEHRPVRGTGGCHPDPIPEQRLAAAESEIIFRAGQVWRKPDRQADFIVDFSDGEQIEVRWSFSHEWGAPHWLSVHELVTYVLSRNLQPDWQLAP